jgi:tetratricopeptide (TPR) repeat protein
MNKIRRTADGDRDEKPARCYARAAREKDVTCLRFLGVLTAIAAACGSAAAASKQDLDDCNKSFGDKGASACSRVIEDANESVSNRANAFFNRGTWLDARGQFDEAIHHYSEAIRLEPKNGERYYIRAHAYRQKGDTEKELADHNEAIRLSPRALHYIGRAYTLVRKGDVDGAIADFTRAIKAEPEWTNTWYHRAKAYTAKGDRQRAIADYRMILKLDPSSTASRAEIKRLGGTP